MNSKFIELKLISSEERLNANAWLHWSVNGYLERQAKNAEMPLEEFIIQQLRKNVKMYDCIGELYVFPECTEVFLNEGPAVGYKTKQVFDPKYRDVQKDLKTAIMKVLERF